MLAGFHVSHAVRVIVNASLKHSNDRDTGAFFEKRSLSQLGFTLPQPKCRAGT